MKNQKPKRIEESRKDERLTLKRNDEEELPSESGAPLPLKAETKLPDNHFEEREEAKDIEEAEDLRSLNQDGGEKREKCII